MFALGELITAMVTPFNKELQVDLDAAHTLMDYLISNGSEGILLSGTTGESPTLTDQEKLSLFRYAVKNFGNRAKIIAGTGTNDTGHAVVLSQEAEKMGVDALLLVVPYYNKPSQTGLYKHFETIAGAVKIPVILYNVPSRTSCNLDAKTCIQLAEIDNIVGVKEASSQFGQISLIVRNTPEDFLVYSGNDGDTLPILSIGGYGVISVASHIAGKQIQEMIRCFKEGRSQEAADIHGTLMDLFEAIFITTNPIPIKTALNLMDIKVGEVRLPLCEMEKDTLAKFKNTLKKYHLIQ